MMILATNRVNQLGILYSIRIKKNEELSLGLKDVVDK